MSYIYTNCSFMVGLAFNGRCYLLCEQSYRTLERNKLICCFIDSFSQKLSTKRVSRKSKSAHNISRSAGIKQFRWRIKRTGSQRRHFSQSF